MMRAFCKHLFYFTEAGSSFSRQNLQIQIQNKTKLSYNMQQFNIQNIHLITYTWKYFRLSVCSIITYP